MRIPLVVFLAILALSNASYTGEAIGKYTRFYQKQSGVAKADNSALSGAWQSCTPNEAACVTLLPSSGLTATNTKAECHTNSGAKNVYTFSGNTDYFTLLSSGTEQNGASNWVDEICGKTIAANDFVTIFIYDVAREDDDWATETAALFQSYMRLWYLYDQSEPVSSSVSVDADAPSVTITYSIKVPPQGSGLNFVPVFLPTPNNIEKQSSWTNLDKTDYCEDPSSFSSTDGSVNSTLNFELEMGYEEYVDLAKSTDEAPLEVSDFEIQLIAYDCTASVPQRSIQKLYITYGDIVYNREVTANTFLAVSHKTQTLDQVEATLRLESTLKFCTNATCVDTLTPAVPAFQINQDAYLLLEISASDRQFNTDDMSLQDAFGNELLGGIELAVHDATQTGRVIYKVKFTRTYAFANLVIEATAAATNRRLLSEDVNASNKTHSATHSMVITACDGEDCGSAQNEEDEDKDDSASIASTAFATLILGFFAWI